MSNKVVRIRKFSKKYSSLLFGAIMGLIMFFLTSLTVTIVNIGIVPNFLNLVRYIFDYIYNLLSYHYSCYSICKEHSIQNYSELKL